jgi:twitching motility protein PilT
MQRGRGHGVVRLDDALAELVRAGRVDLPSARAFAESPDDFEALVAQRPLTQAPAASATATQGMLPKKRPPEEQAMDLGGLLSKTGSLFGKKG